MKKTLRAVLVSSLMALMAACSTPRLVAPTDPIDLKMAYVVVRPHLGTLTLGGPHIFSARLSLLNTDGSTVATTWFQAQDEDTALLALPPGYYFLSEVDTGRFDYRFKPILSVFNAPAGQISYPGDWRIDESYSPPASKSTASHFAAIFPAIPVGTGSANLYAFNPLGDKLKAEIAATFPAHAAAMPVAYTRLEMR